MTEFHDRIINGNCLDVLPLFPANSVDLVITSPPYDNLRSYHGYNFDCKKIATELLRVLKRGGVVVCVVGDAVIRGGETFTSFRQALTFQDVGFLGHDTMIYEKNTCAFPARRDGNRYSQTAEYMFIFSKGPPKTANLLCDKPNKWAGSINWGRNTDRGKDGQLREKRDIKPVKEFSPRNNVWRYVPYYEKDESAEDIVAGQIRRYSVGGGIGHKDKSAYDHPATFPAQLVEDHLYSWSEPGDWVIDPMCGSGTVGVSALHLERHFTGIEISEKYCALAARRTGCDLVYMNQLRHAG
jgi:DNA modification methylase